MPGRDSDICKGINGWVIGRETWKATKTGAETVPEPETRADIWWVAELKANEMINEKDIDVYNLMDLT